MKEENRNYNKANGFYLETPAQKKEEPPPGMNDIRLDTPEKQQKFELFKARNRHIIELWMASHPKHIYPPIYWNEYRKDFAWLTRQERRFKKKGN